MRAGVDTTILDLRRMIGRGSRRAFAKDLGILSVSLQRTNHSLGVPVCRYRSDAVALRDAYEARMEVSAELDVHESLLDNPRQNGPYSLGTPPIHVRTRPDSRLRAHIKVA